MRTPLPALALLVVLVALAAAVTLSVQALAANRPASSSETIGSLTRKVQSLQIQLTTLRLRIGALESGEPGQSLSPMETYNRLRNLDFKLANVCRYNRVVAEITQGYSGQLSATYANC